MINAVIDIGNTNVKIGLFTGKEPLAISVLSQKDVIPYLDIKNVENAMVSSVASQDNFIEQLKKIVAKVTEFTIDTPMPIRTLYATPKSLGVDRLAACVGARKYTSGNVLVIDAGTCITYDVLTTKNEHLGGIISPGINMRLRAMHTFTANLPLVSFSTASLIGQSTQKSLQSGGANGSLAEMKGLIKQFECEFDNLSIIIGGGDAVFFDKNLELNTFVVSNLAVEGLHAIFKYNE